MTQGTRRFVAALLPVILSFCGATGVFGQTSANAKSLRDELRTRYDIVALRDGVGFVPVRPKDDIRLIEVRNGVVAINGNAVSASELRTRLGQDSDLILRVTYLDVAAERALANSETVPAETQTQGSSDQRDSLSQAIAARVAERVSERSQNDHGDKVKIGGGITVARDEVVDGDVVAIGGPVNVDGEVAGDVTAIGGTLTLGPDAQVKGDAVAVGGTVNRDPSAKVGGEVTEVGLGAGLPLSGVMARGVAAKRQLSRSGGLAGTLLRVTFLILSALVVVVLGGKFVEKVADRAAAEPLRAGLAGLVTEVLFVPLLIVTIVVLAVSIIGIPLLLLVPFAVVFAVVLMFVGFTGVACEAGRLLSERFGIRRGPYVTVALGVAALAGITLMARIIGLAGGFVFGSVIAAPLAAIGFLVEYVAWTVGIGALILTWHNSRTRRETPAAAGAPAAGEGQPA